MPSNLQGIPDNAEVWRVGQDLWVVYYVPNTSPPVPIAWQVPPGDAAALGISGVDRTLSVEDFNRSGALDMGNTDEIPNPGPGVHPFDTLVDIYDLESQVKPWLKDPEILARWTGALIEGRDLSAAELQTTEWWQNHSQVERRWLSLNASDPATANQLISDNRAQVGFMLQQSGVDNASPELVNFIADQWTTGKWTQAYATQQVQALSDPFAPIDLDPSLVSFRQGLDTTKGRIEEVRSTISRWLGPAYAAGWSESTIEEWAGALRNNPDAETELIEALRQQRLALFPEYENPNLTYEAIAAPWRGVFQQLWGQVPDETDALFQKVVRMNDLAGAETLLRKEGLKRQNATVTKDFLSDLSSAFGGGVRRADPAIL